MQHPIKAPHSEVGVHAKVRTDAIEAPVAQLDAPNVNRQ